MPSLLASPLDGVDAVLRARGIDTPEKLDQTPPDELGRRRDVSRNCPPRPRFAGTQGPY
jgi:hypothetical protein